MFGDVFSEEAAREPGGAVDNDVIPCACISPAHCPSCGLGEGKSEGLANQLRQVVAGRFSDDPPLRLRVQGNLVFGGIDSGHFSLCAAVVSRTHHRHTSGKAFVESVSGLYCVRTAGLFCTAFSVFNMLLLGSFLATRTTLRSLAEWLNCFT